MPKLAIVDQSVSAGGVERFLRGLIEGMLELPQINKWEITVLLNPRNTAGNTLLWPITLNAPNLHVKFMFDSPVCRLLSKMSKPKRIWGIYGTSFAQLMAYRLMSSFGPLWLRGLVGEARSYIQRYCSQQRFDIVYFAYPYFMKPPRLKVRIVATIHDLNWKHEGLGSIGPEATEMLEQDTPEWLDSCRFLIVSSEFIASELHRFYSETGPKIIVVRPGIPTSNRTPTQTEVDAINLKLNLPEKYLLSVGWVGPHKNQKVLLEALPWLRAKGITLPLVFVGMNSRMLSPDAVPEHDIYVKELLSQADRLGLRSGQDYIPIGYVDDFELECLYHRAVATVQPSLYEAGSFTVIEAVRVGCPVACSKIPAHIEQSALLGDNIHLFDPHSGEHVANVIETLLLKPTQTAEWAAKAAELVGKVYSWRSMALGYLSIFDEAFQSQSNNSLHGG